jgi:type IV fimbrial biogenesis protein FimT
MSSVSVYRRRISTGYSWVEMSVVVAIVATMAVIGGPHLASSWERWRIAQAAQAWLGDVRFARHLAVTRGRPVTVCASADGHRCSGDDQWGSGWIVYEDADGDGVRDVEREPLLKVTHAPTAWQRADRRATKTVEKHITYTPVGRPRQANGAFQAGSLVLCAHGQTWGVRLTMNAAGRWRREEQEDVCR